MDREPQKFEETLESTSENARAIGDQNLTFVSGELQPTSETVSANVEQKLQPPHGPHPTGTDGQRDREQEQRSRTTALEVGVALTSTGAAAFGDTGARPWMAGECCSPPAERRAARRRPGARLRAPKEADRFLYVLRHAAESVLNVDDRLANGLKL